MIEWPTIKLRENEHPWVSYFKQQTLVKNNCINAACTGMPGKGKSWGLIYLLSQADPTFNVDRIFFKASKLLNWVGEGNLTKQKPTAFMLDEAGIDAANVRWWDEVNRGLNAFFQTSRSSNYIFGMTVPFITLISKGVRNLMNVRFYADGYRKDHTIFKRGFVLEYNDDMDKTYKKKLYVIRKGGGLFCQGLKLPKADVELLKEYEKRKESFKLQTYQSISEKLKIYEEKEKIKLSGSNGSVLLKRQQEYYDLRWGGKNRFEVCEILGIGERSAQELERRIRQRGKYMPEDQETRQKISLALKTTKERGV